MLHNWKPSCCKWRILLTEEETLSISIVPRYGFILFPIACLNNHGQWNIWNQVMEESIFFFINNGIFQTQRFNAVQ